MSYTQDQPVFACDVVNPRLLVAPWIGHRRFGYDLMGLLRPRKLVELGTERGCSFFAFCQAVQDLSLDMELIAVDSWRGDEHTSFYGEEVYREFLDVKTQCYGDLPIIVIRDLFTRALSQVADASVDILHIDGCHTYEAVRDDFTSWLPKLAPEGVVLFHDVGPEVRYGSVQYWSELRGTYPYLEFTHSWGLGVLFPKGDRSRSVLLERGDWNTWRQFEVDGVRREFTERLAKVTTDRDWHERELAALDHNTRLLRYPAFKLGQLLRRFRRASPGCPI